MKDKPWIVRTPMGTVWAVRFRTEEAAWRRVVRPVKRASESEEAAQRRMEAGGWCVYHQDVKEAAKDAP